MGILKPPPRSGVLFCLFGLVVIFSGCGGSSRSTNGDGDSANNPIPAVTSISPVGAPQAGPAVNLSVTGSGFIQGSQAKWNNSTLATTYVSGTSLTCQIPAANLNTLGSFDITVVNPSPGGGASAGIAFTVGNPVPVIATLSPNSAKAGSSALSIDITGLGFVTGSLVEWNGISLATTYNSSTSLTAQVPASDLVDGDATISVFNPSPNGGISNSLQFSVIASGTYVRKINLPVNDIVWDSTHARIYASLSSSATPASSIASIDPVAGSVVATQAAGAEPDAIALSSDNSYLYAASNGTGAILRFNLPSLSQDTSLNIQLPNDRLGNQETALVLAVAPGKPHTFAALLGSYMVEPSNTAGMAVFDDSTERPNTISNATRQDDIIWGSDESTLYSSADTSPSDIEVITANPSGLSVNADYQGFGASIKRLHFDSTLGRIYADGGWILDPSNGDMAGSFNLNPLISYFNSQAAYSYMTPLCVPDADNGVVFFIGQTFAQFQSGSGLTILKFDAKSSRLLASLPLDGIAGFPARFIRWGNAGLAFTMVPNPNFNHAASGSGPIYLVDGNFVASSAMADSASGTQTHMAPVLSSMSPQSATVGSTDLTITINGANFGPTTRVQWNGGALATTLVSSTQLQAAIPAASFAVSGNASISLSDGNGGESLTGLTFTILAPLSGSRTILPLNLSAATIAWDPVSQQLLLPVWSWDPQSPNTVVALNPTTGSINRAAALSTDPYAFGITDDGSFVYTGYLAANRVTRLSLPNLDLPVSWELPSNSAFGPLWAFDLAPQPGQSQTVATTLAATNVSPAPVGGIDIYDNGVARAVGIPAGSGNTYEYLQWGTGGSSLYVLNSGNFWNLYTYSVDPTGLTYQSGVTVPGTYNLGSGLRSHFDASTGFLYLDNGKSG